MLVAIVSDGRGGSGDRGIVSIPSASIDNDIAARYKAILTFWIAIFYVNKILYNHLITISRASSLGVGEDGGGGGSLGMPGTGVNSCSVTCFGITCRRPLLSLYRHRYPCQPYPLALPTLCFHQRMRYQWILRMPRRWRRQRRIGIWMSLIGRYLL